MDSWDRIVMSLCTIRLAEFLKSVSDNFLFQASDRLNVTLRVQVEAVALRRESVRQVCTRSNVIGYKKLNATIPIMLFWRANRHGSGYKPVMLLDLNAHSGATKVC